MTGQQRHILAAMGVDVWIPRNMSCQKKSSVSLWRDQIPLEDIAPTKVVSPQVTETQAKPELLKSIEPVALPIDVIGEVVASVDTPVVTLAKERTKLSTLQQTFMLEAYCLDQVILVVESSQLSKQQRQLWTNIQSALPGLYHELKWPLALENFRDARGINAYVQGFLDALAIDKRIIILGQQDVIEHAQAMQIASLQDMIDQPLMKRRLWQLMLAQ